ncbi:PAS domain-containing protein [Thauera sp. WH-1]|uniref:PAS domain-containing protein n=1 Tax=Thauera sp. WH-1 TaxID=3398230 RepID=UPI0039FD97D8
MTSSAQRPGRSETSALIARLSRAQRRLAEGESNAGKGDGELRDLLARTIDHLERLDDGKRQLTHEREAILDALPAHIALIAPEGTIITVNEAWRQFARDNALAGDDAAIGQNYLRTCDEAHGLAADEAVAAAAGIRAVLEGRSERFRLEYPCHSPTATRWFELVATPLHKGQRRGAVVMHINITEQKIGAMRLREQAAILDQAKDAILVWDADLRLRFWNRGAEQLYGWTAAEALGQRVNTLLRADVQTAAEAMTQALEHGTWDGRLRLRRRDGAHVDVECHWTLVREAEGRRQSIIAITTDLGERLELERQLHQAQRLEAVGQLTGGLAHDFNNLLQVILGNAELLVERLQHEPRLAALPALIRSAAQRGAELTARLLSFSRRQPLDPRPTDTDALVQAMAELLERTLGEQIRIEFRLDAGPWEAQVDPAQLESAVLNLCLNARDAMPDGGRLGVASSRRHLPAAAAEAVGLRAGDYVLLEVSDSGVGMTATELAQAFDPFFTTKPPGKGSGLGLSMVYGFARQSGGHIGLESGPGRGTVARLYLPRARPRSVGDDLRVDVRGEPAAATGMRTLPCGRGEQVLLVEDDELVREHVASLLDDLGYRVLTARHGPDALARLAEHPDVDLMFTDVVMPGGMNGRELADAVRRERPTMPVLFTSGYTQNALECEGRLEAGFELLSKPFRRRDLALKLRALLDRAREGHE